VRAQVVQIIGEGSEYAAGQIPFTPRAKKVLELSLREALSLGHDYIGTEQLLPGLVRENKGVASQILLDFDADPEKIRNAVIGMLSGAPGSLPRRSLSSSERQAAVANPELGNELLRVRNEKVAAIQAQDLERAAALRTRERELARQLLPRPERTFTEGRQASTPFERPTRVGLLDTASLAVGGALVAAGSAFGILIGWLIWG
jgi:ATP-dependent Clp protease ATP-binding subunit ClpC